MKTTPVAGPVSGYDRSAMALLSTYRTELMGFAILWTMLYHAQIHIPKALLPLHGIKSLGYAGVDIFFLLSGMGVSFSWRNNPDILAFLSKRLIRIVPIYWFFAFLSILMDQISGKPATLMSVGNFLGFDFLFNGQLDRWFIPAIIICYTIFIGITRLIDRSGVVAGLHNPHSDFSLRSLHWVFIVGA